MPLSDRWCPKLICLTSLCFGFALERHLSDRESLKGRRSLILSPVLMFVRVSKRNFIFLERMEPVFLGSFDDGVHDRTCFRAIRCSRIATLQNMDVSD